MRVRRVEGLVRVWRCKGLKELVEGFRLGLTITDLACDLSQGMPLPKLEMEAGPSSKKGRRLQDLPLQFCWNPQLYQKIRARSKGLSDILGLSEPRALLPKLPNFPKPPSQHHLESRPLPLQLYTLQPQAVLGSLLSGLPVRVSALRFHHQGCFSMLAVGVCGLDLGLGTWDL